VQRGCNAGAARCIRKPIPVFCGTLEDRNLLTEYLLTQYMTGFTRRLLDVESTAPGDGTDGSHHIADDVSMLYLHIPFCKELCPFCSFNRTTFEETAARRYYDGLRKELAIYHDSGFSFSTLYIGGGTPTVLPDELIGLIGHARELWPIKEISVETTPADLEQNVIQDLKTAGVNRLSIGVQSFEDGLLESVNRIKKYGTGADIAAKLRDLGGFFDTLNVDLIFGLDGQTHDHVHRDIEIVKELEIDQVTCYPLMKKLEESPTFTEWLPQMRWEKKAYRLIRETLLPDYQPSSAWCFSRGGGMIDEYIVEHPAYAGAGSGAFGYLNGNLVTNLFSLDEYMRKTDTGVRPTLFLRPFSPGEQLKYQLLMQLFRGVVDFDSLRALNTSGFSWMLRGIEAGLRLFRSIERSGDQFRVRPRTSYLTVLLMKIFFQGVSSLRGLCMDYSDGELPVDQVANGD
jgi:menaquinone C8-methyltransferase